MDSHNSETGSWMRSLPMVELAGGALNLLALGLLAAVFWPVLQGHSLSLSGTQMTKLFGAVIMLLGSGSGFILRRAAPLGIALIGCMICIFG